MMKLLKQLSITALLIIACTASAQTPAPAAAADTTITDIINRSGVISVTHPQALEMRLRKPAAGDSIIADNTVTSTGRVKKIGGYRVQIYSDNNSRTAKNEARAKERAISQTFPDLATYVSYDSPYWRLRVGDCRTRAEADALAAEIKKAFPAYRAEITVVRDRINAVN